MEYNLTNIKFFGLAGIKTNGFEDKFWLLIVILALSSALAYLLGSLNFAVIISKLKYHEDIREKGSKNAGFTNMARIYGKGTGILTLAADILKAVVAVLAAEVIGGVYAANLAGIACILGHCFPVYYRFKGGKGVAVTAAIVLCLEPLIFVILLVIFILIVLFTKYVSIGSIITVLLYPVLLNSLYPVFHGMKAPGISVLCAIATALLVVFMHRENIKRLLAGEENKFIFKKKKSFEKKD